MMSVLFLITFIFGCKDKFTDSDIVSPYLYNSASGLTGVGNEHNLILDYLSFDTTYSIEDTAASLRVFDSTLKYLFIINPTYDTTEVRYYSLPFTYYLAGKNIDTVLKAHFDAIYPTLMPKFSQVEISMINEASDYLNNFNFSGMTNNQIYDHIISKADSLIVDFNAIDWDTVSSASYMKGEAIGGMLSVMKNSAEYWKTQAPTTGETAPVAPIATDVWGYFGGWGKATLLELWDNGKLDIKNSNHRIGAGVAGAAVGSGVKGLKVFGGWLSKVISSPA